jgi:hypothetical protein
MPRWWQPLSRNAFRPGTARHGLRARLAAALLKQTAARDACGRALDVSVRGQPASGAALRKTLYGFTPWHAGSLGFKKFRLEKASLASRSLSDVIWKARRACKPCVPGGGNAIRAAGCGIPFAFSPTALSCPGFVPCGSAASLGRTGSRGPAGDAFPGSNSSQERAASTGGSLACHADHQLAIGDRRVGIRVGICSNWSLVQKLNLSDRITFCGPLHGPAKDAAYASAQAFILPSFSEGLPTTVLEAWAHRLPVLMTAACNLPEGFASGAALEISSEPAQLAQSMLLFDRMSPDPSNGRHGRAGPDSGGKTI